jgi:hypothetical protein
MSARRLTVQGLMVVVLVIAAALAGYRYGLEDGRRLGPRSKYLALVNVTRHSPDSMGHSYQWYDLDSPRDMAQLDADEAKLRAQGAEYFVTRSRGALRQAADGEPRLRESMPHRR